MSEKNTELEAQEVREALFAAFSSRERPEASQGFRLPNFEAQHLSELLGGKAREDVELLDLTLRYPHDETACFAMMKLAGKLYYMPLIASLALEADKSDLVFSLLYQFQVEDTSHLLLAEMTNTEKSAVLASFQYLNRYYPECFAPQEIEKLEELFDH